MKSCPFEYQRHGSPREISPERRERLYLNEGLIFAIFGMEMCRTVITEVHSDHNPKETSYLGHFFYRFYPFRTRCVRPKPHRIGTRQEWYVARSYPCRLPSIPSTALINTDAMPTGIAIFHPMFIS